MQALVEVVTPLVAACAVAHLAGWLAWIRNRSKLGITLLVAGWMLNAALFVVNGLIAREPPMGNMYHVVVLLALCMPPCYGLLARRGRLAWTGSYFAFSSAVPLIGALFMKHDVHWQRMPALQSPWFVPHVFAYMLSYALAAVAFALLVGRWGRTALRLPADGPAYAGAAHQILRLAFPFMTFGLLSGALWAEEAWGVYWSWDPKETWSLLTWGLYLAYLHCRRSPETEGYADPAHAFAFAALIITFLVVNLLPKLASALHSYA
jgi:ABC-type transport system involved in cytochrome c biogenesis permease subunit